MCTCDATRTKRRTSYRLLFWDFFVSLFRYSFHVPATGSSRELDHRLGRDKGKQMSVQVLGAGQSLCSARGRAPRASRPVGREGMRTLGAAGAFFVGVKSRRRILAARFNAKRRLSRVRLLPRAIRATPQRPRTRQPMPPLLSSR